MNTKEKIVVGVAILVTLLLGFIGATRTDVKPYVGGNFNPVVVDFAQGISVNGTQVINNAGAFLRAFAGTSISGTTGTLSSTLSVTGATTLGTLTQGGGIAATSTAATATILLPALFDTENVVDVTPNGTILTITLAASSTLSSFIPTAGQVRTIYIRNATTTANVNIAIVGGTGTALVNTGTTTIVGNTSGSSYARIDFVRQTDTNISAQMSGAN